MVYFCQDPSVFKTGLASQQFGHIASERGQTVSEKKRIFLNGDTLEYQHTYMGMGQNPGT